MKRWGNKHFSLLSGREGHHFDKDHVVYIPKELHRSISHNIFTNEGMMEINNKVLIWLGLSWNGGLKCQS